MPIGQYRADRANNIEHALDNPETNHANCQACVVFLHDRIQRKANTGTGNTHEEYEEREDDHLAFIG